MPATRANKPAARPRAKPSRLQYEAAVPLSSLRHHPKNPRQGDVGAIVESIRAHGVYRPLVVQRKTRFVLAGNHTLDALLVLEHTVGPVVWIECSDDEAERILLVDNRTSDLASYNDNELFDLLRGKIETPTGLTGTGYAAEDVDELRVLLGAPLPARGEAEQTPAAGERGLIVLVKTEREQRTLLDRLTLEGLECRPFG